MLDVGPMQNQKHRAEYTHLGAVTEFMFSHKIGQAFKGELLLKWLQSWGTGYSGMLPSKDAFVFVDNHDNQRSTNPDILTYKIRQQYIMAAAFMLSHPYGIPRVMSSFNFTAFDQGTHSVLQHLLQSHVYRMN